MMKMNCGYLVLARDENKEYVFAGVYSSSEYAYTKIKKMKEKKYHENHDFFIQEFWLGDNKDNLELTL